MNELDQNVFAVFAVLHVENNVVYACIIDMEDNLVRIEDGGFNRDEYMKHPKRYASIFSKKVCCQPNNNNNIYLYFIYYMWLTSAATSVMFYIAPVYRKRFVYIISLNQAKVYSGWSRFR